MYIFHMSVSLLCIFHPFSSALCFTLNISSQPLLQVSYPPFFYVQSAIKLIY